MRMNLRSKCPIKLATLIVALQIISFCAAQTKAEPVTVVTHVDIIPDAYKPQSQETAARLLRDQVTATQRDPGLVSYVVLQQNEASNHFTIVETWRDTQSYQKHQGAGHTVQFRNEIEPFLGGPFDSREHHAFH